MASKQVILRQLQCARGSSAEDQSQLRSCCQPACPRTNVAARLTLSVEGVSGCAAPQTQRPGYAPLAENSFPTVQHQCYMHVYGAAIPTDAVCVITVVAHLQVRQRPTSPSEPPAFASLVGAAAYMFMDTALSDTFTFFGTMPRLFSPHS